MALPLLIPGNPVDWVITYVIPLFFGAFVVRVVVFVDYQNVYHRARGSFFEGGDPATIPTTSNLPEHASGNNGIPSATMSRVSETVTGDS